MHGDEDPGMAFAQMMLQHMMGPRGPQTAVIGGNRSMVFTVNAGGGMHGMHFGAPLGGALGGGCVNCSLAASCTEVRSLLLQAVVTGMPGPHVFFVGCMTPQVPPRHSCATMLVGPRRTSDPMLCTPV